MTLSGEEREKINNFTTNLFNTGLLSLNKKESIMNSVETYNEPTYEYMNPKFMENNEKEKSYSIYKDTFQRKDIPNVQIIYIKSFNNLFLKSDGDILSLEKNEDAIKEEQFEFTIIKEDNSNFIEIHNNDSKYLTIDNNNLIFQTKQNTNKEKWILTPYNNQYLIENVHKKNYYINASSLISIEEGINDSSKWIFVLKSEFVSNYKEDNAYVNKQHNYFGEHKKKYYTLLNEYKTNLIKINLLENITIKLDKEYIEHNNLYKDRLSLINSKVHISKYDKLKDKIVTSEVEIATLQEKIDKYKQQTNLSSEIKNLISTAKKKILTLKNEKENNQNQIKELETNKIVIGPTDEILYKNENEKLKQQKIKKMQKETLKLTKRNTELIKELKEIQEEIITFIETLELKYKTQSFNTDVILSKNEVLLNNFNNTNIKNEVANNKNKKINDKQLKLKYNQEYLDNERRFVKLKSIFLLFITIIIFVFIFSVICSIIMDIYNIYT